MRYPGMAALAVAVLALGVLLTGHLHPVWALLGAMLVWHAVYAYLTM